MDYYTANCSKDYEIYHDYVETYFSRQDYSSYLSFNSPTMAYPSYEPGSVHNIEPILNKIFVKETE